MKSKRLKKYLFVKPKNGGFNKTIKCPIFSFNLRKYKVLHEIYAPSMRYAECHFGFFGWAKVGDWPFLNLSSEKRLKIIDERDLYDY